MSEAGGGGDGVVSQEIEALDIFWDRFETIGVNDKTEELEGFNPRIEDSRFRLIDLELEFCEVSTKVIKGPGSLGARTAADDQVVGEADPAVAEALHGLIQGSEIIIGHKGGERIPLGDAPTV